MDIMTAVRRFSLRDLTEDTQDELVGSLRDAHKRINAARAGQRESEVAAEEAKAHIIASFYEEGAPGKNAEERKRNETMALANSPAWKAACGSLEALQVEYENAQSEMAVVLEEIRAVHGKARLMAGMFFYCGSMGMPIEDMLRSTKGSGFRKKKGAESKDTSRSG